MAIAFVNAATETAFASATSDVLTVSFTANNTGLVLIAIAKDTTTVSSVDGNVSGVGAYSLLTAFSNVGNVRVEIWGTLKVGADTSVTVHYAAATKAVVGALQYSGVLALGATGSNSGSTANPTISLATQDSNNFVVAALGSQGTARPTALTGTLRGTPVATSGGAGASNCAEGTVDNTAASPSSVTCAETLAAAQWAAVAVELRTVAPTGIPNQLMMTGAGI